MIKEIRAEFKQQNFSLESFLLANFDRYQEKYQLSELLMYLNLDKICAEEHTLCPMISNKLKDLVREEWN